MKGIRSHLTPILHNGLGGIVTAGALAVLSLVAASTAQVRQALGIFLNAPMPLWAATVVVLVTALIFKFIAYRRGMVLQSDRGEQKVAIPQNDYVQIETKAEMQRKEKLIGEQLQELRQVRGYVALLEGRLREKGLSLPNPPPPPPAVIAL